MNAMSQAMRAIGVMTITGLGGVLSRQSVNAPFMLVGLFDALIVLIVLILILGKWLKD